MIDRRDWTGVDLLQKRAASTPERPGFVDVDGAFVDGNDDGSSLTFAAYDRLVSALGAGLSHHVEHGDRVALLIDDWPAVPPVALATLRCGATVAPLHVTESDAGIEGALGVLEPSLVVCDGATWERVSGVTNRAIRCIDERASSSTAVPLRRGDPSASPDRWPDPDDTAVVLFTSGTTGEPAGVRLTPTTLVSSAAASGERIGLSPDDRWLAPLSPSHAGGFLPIVRTIVHGTGLVVQPNFDVEETARAVREHHVTGLSLVPTMLRRLLDDGWSPPDHLRAVLCGGAPASVSIVERCEEREVPVHPTYGLTETAAGIATARPPEAFANPGTVGRPHPGVQIDVAPPDADSAMGDAPIDDESGEIAVSGATVTSGYLDETRTAAAFDDQGRFRTGDRGRIDTAGRLWIEGRIDRRITTGGETVVPSRVEAALRSHPDVDDAAVVGLDDPEWGERVGALVAGTVEPETLVTDLRERLADHERPRTWIVQGDVPRTASGSVDTRAVRQRLDDRGQRL